MSYRELAEQFCDVQFYSAKKLDELRGCFPSRGETGVMLCLLRRSGPALSGELAKKTGLSSGRMANILSSLEKKGFIRRETDLLDRRQVFVYLTQDGEHSIIKTYDDAIDYYVKFLESLGEEDALAAVRILKKAVKFSE